MNEIIVFLFISESEKICPCVWKVFDFYLLLVVWKIKKLDKLFKSK